MSSHLKILTVVGTRSEIIRLSRVIALLDQHVKHVLVHTGRKSDYELNDVFFRDLGVRRPDHFLHVNRATAGTVLGDVLVKVEAVLDVERPDAVLVLGDTDSAYAAVIARRMRIPVYHMEAGVRSFDENVPEEINRRVIDHVSDFNLVPTEHARRNLLGEGIKPQRIFLTGSPMREVLDENRAGIAASNVVDRLQLEHGEYVLVSMHRTENVDVPRHLLQFLETLNRLGRDYPLPIVVSISARTRQQLEALPFDCHQDVRFLPPLGYHDFLRLQSDAFCTLSDSATVNEEASILGFPAVAMRSAVQRAKAIDTGHIPVSGLEPEAILRSIRLVTTSSDQGRHEPIADGYDIRNTSSRVVELILGTATRDSSMSRSISMPHAA